MTKKHWLILIVALLLIAAAYYFFFRKKQNSSGTESSFKKGDNLPDIGNFEYQMEVATEHDKSMFPLTLTKFLPGVIELPFKDSLVKKGVPYKFIDVDKGQKVKIVGKKLISYAVNGTEIVDNFLITDTGYLLAYTQAVKHFVVG